MGGWLQVVLCLVNDRDLQLEYTRVLNESLLVPVVMYGSENFTKILVKSEILRSVFAVWNLQFLDFPAPYFESNVCGMQC